MKKLLLSFVLMGIVFSCVMAQIPTDGLVAWYPFNGNANDASGNNLNGIVNGALLTTDRFGNQNSAYYFGGNDWIEVLNNSLIDFEITENYSISLWIKPDYDNEQADVLTKWNSSYDPYPYHIRCWGPQVSNPCFASGRSIGGLPQDSTTGQATYYYLQINPNKYYHIVSVFTPDTLKLYVNNTLVAISLNYMNPGNISNDDNLFIGRRGNFELRYFKGIIDDIRIYNRSLNNQEIQVLYNEGICYQYITVTDTLIINANITEFNPVSYQNTIKIYPNPTSDHLIIDFGNNFSSLTGYTLKITNSLSQTVYESFIYQQITTLDLNTWTGNGIYFVYLIDDKSNILDIKKIVLQ